MFSWQSATSSLLLISQVSTHPSLESRPLFQSQRVRLGNDRHNVDHLCKLFEHDNVNLGIVSCAYRYPQADHRRDAEAYRLQSVTCRVDEEQTAVNAGVGDMAVAQGGEFFAEVRRVLVFDLSRQFEVRYTRMPRLSRVRGSRYPFIAGQDAHSPRPRRNAGRQAERFHAALQSTPSRHPI